MPINVHTIRDFHLGGKLYREDYKPSPLRDQGNAFRIWDLQEGGRLYSPDKELPIPQMADRIFTVWDFQSGGRLYDAAWPGLRKNTPFVKTEDLLRKAERHYAQSLQYHNEAKEILEKANKCLEDTSKQKNTWIFPIFMMGMMLGVLVARIAIFHQDAIKKFLRFLTGRNIP